MAYTYYILSLVESVKLGYLKVVSDWLNHLMTKWTNFRDNLKVTCERNDVGFDKVLWYLDKSFDK